MTRNKADDFLRAMSPETVEESASQAAAVGSKPVPKIRSPRKTLDKPVTRAGLKHFGGYLDDETIEKIAVLRARLKMDNSELIKLAIEDLHSKQKAKRAFGDA